MIVTKIDKFGDKVALCCKRWYRRTIIKSLRGAGYEEIDAETEESIVERLNRYCESEGLCDFVEDEDGICENEPTVVSHDYMLLKLHKPAAVSGRLISGGSNVPTTPMSKTVSVCLRAFIPLCDKAWSSMFMQFTGLAITRCPILMTTDEAIEHVRVLNRLSKSGFFKMEDIVLGSHDFTALYPSVPQSDLIRVLNSVINFVFQLYRVDYNKTAGGRDEKCVAPVILVGKFPNNGIAKFHPKVPVDLMGLICITKQKLKEYVRIIIGNSYGRFDGKIWRSIIGFPMGPNAAPEFANLYLLAYEMGYFNRQLKRWAQLSKAKQIFLISYKRYIDDILVASREHAHYMRWFHKSADQDGMFPIVLPGPLGKDIMQPLQLTGTPGQKCVNFLDVTIMVNDTIGHLTWKLFDKRNDLTINAIKLSSWRNFPHIKTALANSCKLGVVTSQLYRFN